MKKLLTLCLALIMTIFAIDSLSGFATETTTESIESTESSEGTESTEGTTEGTESTEDVVLFDYDFEDYKSSDVNFPKSKTENVKEGSWDTLMSAAGSVVGGIDGNKFKITKSASSGMYNLYNFSPYLTGGKYLLSFDMEYNMFGTAGRTTWSITNKVVTNNEDGTTSTTNQSMYLLALENPSGNGPALYSTSVGTHSNRTKLLTFEKDKMYTVDILMDLDAMTKTYYINGVQMDHYHWTGKDTTVANFSAVKFNLNANIAGIDNFKLIKNPTKYSFKAVDTTTEEEWVTVKFSNAVNPSASDFVITEKVEDTATEDTATEDTATEETTTEDTTTEETTEPTQIAVSEIEQVTGTMYKIKPATALSAGNYIVSLANTELASVIGTTPANTTADFAVKNVKTHFEIDFEEFATAGGTSAYFNTFNQNGAWSFGSQSGNITASNTYAFEGDVTNGVAGTGSKLTRAIHYTFNEPIESGIVRISFDAGWDYEKREGQRGPLLYVNKDTTNGNVMYFGLSTEAAKITSGSKVLKYNDGNGQVAFENNKAYRWDTVIDLDNNTVQNFCDGVRFGNVTYTVDITPLTTISFHSRSALVFFDNYKITHNVETFGYTAADIASDSNETIVNFDDTMVIADGDMVFTSPDGETIVPDSITKITPRKYKVALPDLEEGVYTMTLKDGKTSALGNTPKMEEVTFNVAARPVKEFVATELAIAEAEGGATLSVKVTNSFDEEKNAVMLIALYDENDEMVECYAEEVPVDAGADAALKSITMTTTKDLSAYTVKGFIWSVEDSFYPLCDSVTK